MKPQMLKTSNKTLIESFLTDNNVYEECEVPDDMHAIGNLHNIDLDDNDIWIMQCPKKMDIKQLTTQTIKMPGRTNFEDFETICTDITEGARRETFAYHHKGKFTMRLLPITGTIIVRNRLKANNAITADEIEASFRITKRVPMPKNLRVRHPLFGRNYEETDLNVNIKARLKEADENSLKLLKQVISDKTSCKSLNDSAICKRKRKTNEMPMPIKVKKEKPDDSDIEFTSETFNTKKYKDKMSLNGSEKKDKKKQKCKNKNSQNGDIIDNLEWLSKI